MTGRCSAALSAAGGVAASPITGAIARRPAIAADEPFLFRVFTGTRAEELAMLPWDAATKDAFLRAQFAAQRRSYAAQFPNAEQTIVLCDGAPVGQLTVDRSAQGLLLVDLGLLPERRNAGIGTALLTWLQGEAAGAGVPLRLHVLAGNRAIRLYERLGFTIVGRGGMHLEMVWISGHPGREGKVAAGANPER